jgi:signal transduction histidine kinase
MGATGIRRLRTYLVALALAGVLPLGGFSVGVAWWASSLEREAGYVELHRLAAQSAAVVAMDIVQSAALLQVFARSPALISGDMETFERHLRSVAADTGIALSVANVRGELVINTAVPPGTNFVAQPRPDLAEKVLASGKLLLTDTIPGPMIHRPIAGLIIPVPDGRPEATFVTLRVDPLQLVRLLPQALPWPGAFTAVYDGRGETFMSTASQETVTPELPDDLAHNEVPATPTASSMGLVAAVAPIAGTTWHAAVFAPEAVLANPWHTALRRMVIAACVAIAAGALFAVLLGRFLLREAGALVDDADAIAGEGPPAIAESRVYEVNVLRRALQAGAMAAHERILAQARAASLAATAAALEARVAERTRELEETTGRLLNAQDEERRRIARELHDSTVQELVAASLNLSAAQGSANPRCAPELEEARAALDRAKDELRTVAFLMQPPMLDECGVATALRIYAEGLGRRTGLAIEIDAPEGDPVLPRAVETALFRVAQEALANVHRHANSASACVRLRVTDTEVGLDIEDDGVGIASGERSHVGAGIIGMRARVRQLGGDLSIDARAAGTRVKVRVPVVACNHSSPGAQSPAISAHTR